MISKTDLQDLRNGEAIKFFSNLNAILVGYALTQLSTLQAQLKAAYDQLIIAYKLERGSKVTTSLITLDKLRDTYFIALRIILGQHASSHPQEDMRPKAAKLLEVVTRHGITLHRKNYQEQTAGMDDICRIIDEDSELVTIIDELHLTDYYVAMKTTNQEFDAKYLERNSEYASMPDESLTSLRDQAEESFRELVKHLNAHLVLAEDPAPFQELAAELNTLLESYYEVVERRKSGGGAPAGDTDEEALDADFEEAATEEDLAEK